VTTPCDNPFQDVPESAFEQWSRIGVNIGRLRAMPAREVDPSSLEPFTQTIVNMDSNLVVVITERLMGMRTVVSAGPLVVMNNASGIQHLVSDSTIWIRDEAEIFNTSVGHPIVFSGTGNRSFGRAFLSPTYIWPKGDGKGGDWRKRLLETKTIDEVARILGHSTPSYIEPSGPEQDLVAVVGASRAHELLAEHPDLAGAALAIASGTHFGSGAVDIVQTNPKVVLVLQRGFATHGGVFAAGPVVIVSGAQASPLLSQSWIDDGQRPQRVRRPR
jgi:hypothetical protein